ncbi:hypothetical protein [Rhizobium sp. BR 249]|uniref:hypothetical protein n=1 Tax=Rhizobium sp. BR 249 TaxID=3040011 RepID=UPI0039BFBEE2
MIWVAARGNATFTIFGHGGFTTFLAANGLLLAVGAAGAAGAARNMLPRIESLKLFSFSPEDRGLISLSVAAP